MGKSKERILELIEKIDGLITFYMSREEDRNLNDGNAALCIISEEGEVFGKLYVTTSKIRTRETFRVAWTKASQVWITGMKTGEYEKKVYSGEISEHTVGLRRPDLIGWEGGQPIVLKDGLKLSVGFSGFRGVSDLEIVAKAAAQL